MNKALNGEKDYDIEFRIKKSDGSVNLMRGIAAIIRDNIGKPVRMIGTNWDITNQKKKLNSVKIRRINNHHIEK